MNAPTRSFHCCHSCCELDLKHKLPGLDNLFSTDIQGYDCMAHPEFTWGYRQVWALVNHHRLRLGLLAHPGLCGLLALHHTYHPLAIEVPGTLSSDHRDCPLSPGNRASIRTRSSSEPGIISCIQAYPVLGTVHRKSHAPQSTARPTHDSIVPSSLAPSPH